MQFSEAWRKFPSQNSKKNSKSPINLFFQFFSQFSFAKMFHWTRWMQFWQTCGTYFAQSPKNFRSRSWKHHQYMVFSKKYQKCFSEIQSWKNLFLFKIELIVLRADLIAASDTYIFHFIFEPFLTSGMFVNYGKFTNYGMFRLKPYTSTNFFNFCCCVPKSTKTAD